MRIQAYQQQISTAIRKQIRQGEGSGTEFKSAIRNLETIAHVFTYAA